MSTPTYVSIHAPAKGATLSQLIDLHYRRVRFNSRAREGRDPGPRCRRYAGACFNSRAREGRDIQIPTLFSPDLRFNSRAREGRD